MKVGDYVRTDTGDIGKITKIIGEEKNIKDCYLNFKDMVVYGKEEDVVGIQGKAIKSSPNIIDLIEVGDYVNGERVLKIYEVNDYYEYSSSYRFYEKTIETENDEYECIPDSYLYKNKDIKSIVTKEQFESMEYKVGD